MSSAFRVDPEMLAAAISDLAEFEKYAADAISEASSLAEFALGSWESSASEAYRGAHER